MIYKLSYSILSILADNFVSKDLYRGFVGTMLETRLI